MSGVQREPVSREVLVAEDDASMRLLLAHTLVSGGFAVRMVADGHLLRHALQDPGSPRLVVTDWEMPGPTGVEICRELRARPEGNHFYLVVVTGHDGHDHLLEALAAGANDFIRKPFQPAELLARVRAGHRVLDLQESLGQRVAELAQALAEVRTLRGLVPICMHCHRIRTNDDHWQRLEAYLEAHSEAELSHGLCNDCLEKHYPERRDSEAE